MDEEEKSEEANAEGVSLEDIAKACLDSGGYVIFAACLTNKVDKDKNRLIDFHYRRYHFGFEDVKEAVRAFKNHYLQDVNEGLDI